MSWLSKLFSPSDRRHARRQQSPTLLAFYWDGELPAPHAVPDISNNGIFVKTDDRWTESSMLRVTLQTQSEDPEKSGETITVQCRVVRTEQDGVGMAIMLAEDGKSGRATSGSLATRKEFRKFLEHLGTEAAAQPPAESSSLPFPEAGQAAEQAAGQTTDPVHANPQTAEQAPKEDA